MSFSVNGPPGTACIIRKMTSETMKNVTATESRRLMR
jgi:hypothetical protein